MAEIFYHLERADKFVYHYTKAETLADLILPSAPYAFHGLQIRMTRASVKIGIWVSVRLGTLAALHIGVGVVADRSIELTQELLSAFCTTADDASAVGMGIDKIYGRGFCQSSANLHGPVRGPSLP